MMLSSASGELFAQQTLVSLFFHVQILVFSVQLCVEPALAVYTHLRWNLALAAHLLWSCTVILVVSVKKFQVL